MLCHVLSLAGLVVPFGNIIGPLVLWLVKREDPFVDAHGKESMNFQISLTIYMFAILLLAIALPGMGVFVLMIFVMMGLVIFEIIEVVLASLAASRGAAFRYPLTIRFIR